MNVGTSSCANFRNQRWTQCKFEGKIRNIFPTYLFNIYLIFLTFSRVFRRNSTTTKTNLETSTPVEPQVQDKNKDTTEIQSSGSKRKTSDNTDLPRDNVTVSKISDSNLKARNQCVGVYLQGWLHMQNNNMYLHIAEKELKDKILLANPVPVNQEFSLKRNDVILKDF